MAPKSIIDYKFQKRNGNQNSSRTTWKPSLLWIRLLGTAILLLVVGRFLLSNNDMNLFYPHDIPHIEKLDGPVNYASDNDGSNLPLCQRTDQFIIFHDVDPVGFGLFHKLEDFFAACRMAILTNRTLIDYAPALTRRCNLDVNGTERQTDNSTSFLWKFSDLFDLSNLHFAYWTENAADGETFDTKGGKDVKYQEEHNCRLSVLTDASDEIHWSSVLKFEYGLPNFKKTRAFFITHFLLDWAAFKHQRKIHIRPMFTGKPPFSEFFRNAAEGIKRQCMMSTFSNSGTRKFYVVHLRGTDRPCIVEWMTSAYLIRKIESFNITKNDVIYLMTDLKREHDNVTALKQHFGNSLFVASDIEIFSASPFKEDNYLVFTAELALQKISDGFLSAYKNHPVLREKNEVGTLMQRDCHMHTMQKMTPKEIKEVKSIYQAF